MAKRLPMKIIVAFDEEAKFSMSISVIKPTSLLMIKNQNKHTFPVLFHICK
jgi:hypothetical protein